MCSEVCKSIVTLMERKAVIVLLLFLTSLVDSTERSGITQSNNVGAGSSLVYGWTICSAGVFVLAALVLSMYLIFEHLAAYNQPEEQKFLIGLILMVPVYASESVRKWSIFRKFPCLFGMTFNFVINLL